MSDSFTVLWWIVYCPRTGDVLYNGPDNDAAKKALEPGVTRRQGYICQPLTMHVIPTQQETPDPGGVIGEPPTKPIPPKRTRKAAK